MPQEGQWSAEQEMFEVPVFLPAWNVPTVLHHGTCTDATLSSTISELSNCLPDFELSSPYGAWSVDPATITQQSCPEAHGTSDAEDPNTSGTLAPPESMAVDNVEDRASGVAVQTSYRTLDGRANDYRSFSDVSVALFDATPFSTVASRIQRRKEQNRASQKKFRVRQQQALADATVNIRSLRAEIKAVQGERDHFERLHWTLKHEHEQLLGKFREFLSSA